MNGAGGVVVGLVATFAVLAAAASGVLDLIRYLSRSRERYLFRALGQVLDDTPTPTIGSYTARLYDTTAVKQSVHPRKRTWLTGDEPPPMRRTAPDPLVRKRRYGPVWMLPTSFADAALEVTGGSVGPFAALAMPADGAQVTSEGPRAQLANGFDLAMRPMTVRYRQITRVWLFLLGAALAVAVNVDTIDLAHDFYARGATSAAACAGAPAGAEEPGAAPCELPVGWPCPHDAQSCSVRDRLSAGFDRSSIPGWLLSAAAVSFGAPFWYGLLSRTTRKQTRVDPMTGSSAGATR